MSGRRLRASLVIGIIILLAAPVGGSLLSYTRCSDASPYVIDLTSPYTNEPNPLFYGPPFVAKSTSCVVVLNCTGTCLLAINTTFGDPGDYVDVFDGPTTGNRLARLSGDTTGTVVASINYPSMMTIVYRESVYDDGAGSPFGISLFYQNVTSPPLSYNAHCAGLQAITVSSATAVAEPVPFFNAGLSYTGNNCSWLLTGAGGQRLVFTVASLRLQAGDALIVYDGGDSNAPIMQFYSVADTYVNLNTSTTSRVYVSLLAAAPGSAVRSGFAGFQATANVAPQLDPTMCISGGARTVNFPTWTSSVASFDGSLPAGSNCTMTFTGVNSLQITFNGLSLSQGDSISVYETVNGNPTAMRIVNYRNANYNPTLCQMFISLRNTLTLVVRRGRGVVSYPIAFQVVVADHASLGLCSGIRMFDKTSCGSNCQFAMLSDMTQSDQVLAHPTNYSCAFEFFNAPGTEVMLQLDYFEFENGDSVLIRNGPLSNPGMTLVNLTVGRDNGYWYNYGASNFQSYYAISNGSRLNMIVNWGNSLSAGNPPWYGSFYDFTPSNPPRCSGTQTITGGSATLDFGAPVQRGLNCVYKLLSASPQPGVAKMKVTITLGIFETPPDEFIVWVGDTTGSIVAVAYNSSGPGDVDWRSDFQDVVFYGESIILSIKTAANYGRAPIATPYKATVAYTDGSWDGYHCLPVETMTNFPSQSFDRGLNGIQRCRWTVIPQPGYYFKMSPSFLCFNADFRLYDGNDTAVAALAYSSHLDAAQTDITLRSSSFVFDVIWTQPYPAPYMEFTFVMNRIAGAPPATCNNTSPQVRVINDTEFTMAEPDSNLDYSVLYQANTRCSRLYMSYFPDRYWTLAIKYSSLKPGASVLIYDGTTTNAPLLFSLSTTYNSYNPLYTTPMIMTTGPNFLIVFNGPANGLNANLGFAYHIAATSYPLPVGRSVAGCLTTNILSADTTVGRYVTDYSGGLPHLYNPGHYCNYQITAPVGWVIDIYNVTLFQDSDFRIAEEIDSDVSSDNGYWFYACYYCGYQLPSYIRSSTNVVSLQFNMGQLFYETFSAPVFSFNWRVVQPAASCSGTQTLTGFSSGTVAQPSDYVFANGWPASPANYGPTNCTFNFVPGAALYRTRVSITFLLVPSDVLRVYDDGVLVFDSSFVFGTFNRPTFEAPWPPFVFNYTSICGNLSVTYTSPFGSGAATQDNGYQSFLFAEGFTIGYSFVGMAPDQIPEVCRERPAFSGLCGGGCIKNLTDYVANWRDCKVMTGQLTISSAEGPYTFASLTTVMGALSLFSAQGYVSFPQLLVAQDINAGPIGGGSTSFSPIAPTADAVDVIAPVENLFAEQVDDDHDLLEGSELVVSDVGDAVDDVESQIDYVDEEEEMVVVSSAPRILRRGSSSSRGQHGARNMGSHGRGGGSPHTRDTATTGHHGASTRTQWAASPDDVSETGPEARDVKFTPSAGPGNQPLLTFDIMFPALTEVTGTMKLWSNIKTFQVPILKKARDIEVKYLPVYTTVSMPALQQASSLNMQAQTIQSLDFPALQTIPTIDISGDNVVSMNFPALSDVDEFSLQYSHTETAFLPSLQVKTATFAYNQLLKTLVLGRINPTGSIVVSGNFLLATLNLTSSVTAIGSLSISSSKLTSLTYPNVQSIGSLTLSANNDMTEIIMEGATSMGNLNVANMPKLTTIQMPALVTMTGIGLEGLRSLSTLEFCGLTSASNVNVTNCPALSCVEVHRMFEPVGARVDAAVPGCSGTAVGTFGCLVNATLTVNASICNYTVACIQSQIDRAYSEKGIDVFIPAGTYTGCNNTLSFGGKGITVRGEGMGLTVIDCQGVGRGIVFNQGEHSSAVLEDLTIMNGQADMGGAILLSGTSPLINRCNFSASTATTGSGGAIAVVGGSKPYFTDCYVLNNVAAVSGGGVYVEDSWMSFVGGNISANLASANGGGVYYTGASTSTLPPPLDFVVLSANTAARGGAVYAEYALTSRHVSMLNNVAADFGGALAAVPSTDLGTWFNFTDATISGNSAGGGGGIFGFSANLEIRRSTLRGNSAGLDGGGALSSTCSQNYRRLCAVVQPCPLYGLISGSEISGNHADGDGGGLLVTDMYLNLKDVVQNDNHALINGGGTCMSVGALMADNVTWISNRADSQGGGLYCEPFTGDCVVQNSQLRTNSAAISGGGIFLCTSSCPNTTATLSGNKVIGDFNTGNVLLGNTLDVNGYGADEATDPSSLAWDILPVATVVSGEAVAATAAPLTVRVTDTYSQIVTVSDTTLTLSLSVLDSAGQDATSLVKLGGAQTVLASSGIGQFDGVTLSALSAAACNQPYILRAALSELDAVNLDWGVTVAGCADGRGRSVATDPVTCGPCAAGTYGTAATEYTCTPCPAGYYAGAANSAACTPCAINFYAAGTGSTACLACPDGFYTEATGATVCAGSGRADAITGALSASTTGMIAGIAAGVLVGICIVAFCLYRTARKRTMRKYYLDNDATIRTGTQETPLQKEVAKILLASSTTRIGGGMYSNVYKVKYEGSYIALKVIKGEMATNGTAQQEFRREAVALSRLEDRKHPGIIALRFFLNFNPMCIGVAFCNGGSLKAALMNGLFSKPSEKARVIAEAASGMAVIHSCNIVHLDVKTDNFLLTSDYHVIVADFGIARTLGNSSLSLPNEYLARSGDSSQFASQQGPSVSLIQTSEAEDTAFTPQYVDPLRIIEDRNGDEVYLPRADIFSFGTLMWAVWSGIEPYAGENPHELIERLRDNPSLRPGPLTGCPEFYETMMNRCWMENPYNRPSFAEVFEFMKANLPSLGEQLGPGYDTPNLVPLSRDRAESGFNGGGHPHSLVTENTLFDSAQSETLMHRRV